MSEYIFVTNIFEYIRHTLTRTCNMSALCDICLEMTDNKNILLTYMYSLILISCWHICTHCEISIEVPWLKLKDSWVPKWLKQIIVKASLVISPFLILNFLIRTPQQIVNSWWFARLCQWHMGQILQDGENSCFIPIFFKSRGFVWPNLMRYF